MRVYFLLILFFGAFWARAGEALNCDIVVAKDGTGQFTSIQKALESVPDYNYERVVIYIKNGTYNEKLRIQSDFITLVGESRDSTIISFSQPRPEWQANPDAIGPAVVNIFADDIILKNLTIINTQPEKHIHAFSVYGEGTRTIILNCNVLSDGGDTVSLWNYKEGMYYHSNCYFKGAVDFVCPRGWCYIDNSKFFEVRNTAAVWHAAVENPNQKFVLKNCEFQGADSFYLGRHHYEAQFYFLNCHFPDILLNKPIAQVHYKDHPEKDMPYFYGDRHYFYNCLRDAGNYTWFNDNTDQWPNAATPDSITPVWTFDYKWDPTDTGKLAPVMYTFDGNLILLYFNEPVMERNCFTLKSSDGEEFSYESGSGRKIIRLKGAEPFKNKAFSEPLVVTKGFLQATTARVNDKVIRQGQKVNLKK